MQEGNTLLHHAAKRGLDEVVKLLLDHGVNRMHLNMARGPPCCALLLACLLRVLLMICVPRSVYELRLVW
jgi:ankyrin repeat protein